MEIFGSYMTDEHTLPGEAVRICALDTFVALHGGHHHLPRLLHLRRDSRTTAPP